MVNCERGYEAQNCSEHNQLARLWEREGVKLPWHHHVSCCKSFWSQCLKFLAMWHAVALASIKDFLNLHFAQIMHLICGQANLKDCQITIKGLSSFYGRAIPSDLWLSVIFAGKPSLQLMAISSLHCLGLIFVEDVGNSSRNILLNWTDMI